MMVEVSNLFDVPVYTHKGIYLGRVYDIQLDITNSKIYEIILSDTNGELVEFSRNIGIPYRWVKSISDVIVLRYFPGKIRVKPKPDKAWRRHKQRVLKSETRWGDHGVSRTKWR
ncbi:MAG: PRC-barrel domain-containing protein [Thermoplasmata archaeon]|nr:MAG: PRC-barrel domain-containing protein [Thermoplasmata archaeon]